MLHLRHPLLTGINMFMYLAQLREANPICHFNDLLPYRVEVQSTAMPITWYCRFLRFSVPVCIFQLLFCFAALCCGLRRYNNLFILCYGFLCLTLLLSAAFLIGMMVITAFRLIATAVHAILTDALVDSQFCAHIAPTLNCTMRNANGTDTIAQRCGKRIPEPMHQDCFASLTDFHGSTRGWQIGLIIEYVVITLAVIGLCIRCCYRHYRSKHNGVPSSDQNSVVSNELKASASYAYCTVPVPEDDHEDNHVRLIENGQSSGNQ